MLRVRSICVDFIVSYRNVILLFLLLVGHKCQHRLKSSALVHCVKKHIRVFLYEQPIQRRNLIGSHSLQTFVLLAITFWENFIRFFWSSHQGNVGFSTQHTPTHTSDHPTKLHQIASVVLSMGAWIYIVFCVSNCKSENKYQRKSTLFW